MNNHNVRHHAPQNMAPEFKFDVGNAREKVWIWMVLCGSGAVIEQIFLEGILTRNSYLNLLIYQIIPELFKIQGKRMNSMWWVQDSASCHRTIPVHNLLTDVSDVCSTRINAVNHEVEWPRDHQI